ncbi:hypothetical protein FF38_12549 [Lucilia cuprina]|uniref:Uncharacterized protein n=1 Tax=Lucilia cuprina TaxID=7375 RepID=A0A0L0BNB4_LUCCU|nr:hypothetical protein FF38_12549 [Lucilia cuprina]
MIKKIKSISHLNMAVNRILETFTFDLSFSQQQPTSPLPLLTILTSARNIHICLYTDSATHKHTDIYFLYKNLIVELSKMCRKPLYSYKDPRTTTVWLHLDLLLSLLRSGRRVNVDFNNVLKHSIWESKISIRFGVNINLEKSSLRNNRHHDPNPNTYTDKNAINKINSGADPNIRL